MAQTTPSHRASSRSATSQVVISRRVDGSIVLRSPQELKPYPERLSDRFAHWARVTPEQCFVAQRERGASGHRAWQHISYAQMLERARAVAQATLELELSAERPVLILSENDIDHLTMMLAMAWVGVPTVSLSPAHSLKSKDFQRLLAMSRLVTPGLIFASDPDYAPAIAALDNDLEAKLPVILSNGTIPGRETLAFQELITTLPGRELDAAHQATGPETILKFMFTSGSTGAPKAVPTTNRMLCANQQMIQQCLPFLTEEPPVLLDWLPWSHVFGSSHNLGMVIFNGGTLYIDDGRPTHEEFGKTLQNLREVSPSLYLNVPMAFAEVALAMDTDTALRSRFFHRCKAVMYAGASLGQDVWNHLQALAKAELGTEIPVMSGLGMTEAGPACTTTGSALVQNGTVGLPLPGVEMKLVPNGSRLEARFKGPNLMRGYWRAPELNKVVFDEEGFYRSGDAVRWASESDPEMGLCYDGRLGDEFKLSTGIFVNTGALRTQVMAAGEPLVLDAAITGAGRDQIGALLFPRLEACREYCGLPPGAAIAEVLTHVKVRTFFQELARRLLAEGKGSSGTVARFLVDPAPLSAEAGEVTEKGTLNQKNILTRRAEKVVELYADAINRPLRFDGHALE